jgi:hypothetical protein
MLLFVDLSARKFHHATFNAGLIKVLSLVVGEKNLNILVHEDHKEALLDCGVLQSALFYTLDETIAFREYSILLNPLPIIRIAWNIMNNARALGAKIVIIGDAHPLLIAFIRFTAFFRAPNVKFHMLFHGSLVSLLVWNSRNPLRRLFDWPVLLKWKMPSFIRYLALEFYIKESVGIINSNLLAQWDVFAHPVLTRSVTMKGGAPTAIDHKKWNIGFIGAARINKGFEKFLLVAKHFDGNPQTKFHAIGVVEDVPLEKCTGLATKPANKQLDEATYSNLVSKLDIIIIIFDSEEYKYISSGTYLDAISFGKPVIAIGYPGATKAALEKFKTISSLPGEQQAIFLIEKLIYDDSGQFYEELMSEILAERQLRADLLLAERYKELVAQKFDIHFQ